MLAAVIPPSSSFTSFKTELNLPELWCCPYTLMNMIRITAYSNRFDQRVARQQLCKQSKTHIRGQQYGRRVFCVVRATQQETSIARQCSGNHSFAQKRCILCSPCGVYIRKACS
jgi:hypothetical protein